VIPRAGPPKLTSRRATAADRVPARCAQVPRERSVVVSVSCPALKHHPRLPNRTYLVSLFRALRLRKLTWQR
jgi:hypothetical protein